MGSRPMTDPWTTAPVSVFRAGRLALLANGDLVGAGLDELVPKTLAAATVDRLLHHAHVLLTRRHRQLPPRSGHRRPGGVRLT
jgi:hypothetical protein